MTAPDRVALREAIKRGWLHDSRRNDPSLFNAYWDWCKNHDRPCVWIRRRQRYAEVTVDMFTVYRDLTESAVDAVQELLTAAHASPGFVSICRNRCSTNHVPIEAADDLARTLLELASDAANTRGIRWDDR